MRRSIVKKENLVLVVVLLLITAFVGCDEGKNMMKSVVQEPSDPGEGITPPPSEPQGDISPPKDNEFPSLSELGIEWWFGASTGKEPQGSQQVSDYEHVLTGNWTLNFGFAPETPDAVKWMIDQWGNEHDDGFIHADDGLTVTLIISGNQYGTPVNFLSLVPSEPGILLDAEIEVGEDTPSGEVEILVTTPTGAQRTFKPEKPIVLQNGFRLFRADVESSFGVSAPSGPQGRVEQSDDKTILIGKGAVTFHFTLKDEMIDWVIDQFGSPLGPFDGLTATLIISGNQYGRPMNFTPIPGFPSLGLVARIEVGEDTPSGEVAVLVTAPTGEKRTFSRYLPGLSPVSAYGRIILQKEPQ